MINLKAKLKELRELVFSNKTRLDNLVLTDNNYTDADKAKLWDIAETVLSGGADLAEVGTWFDRNHNKENRLYRFVTIVGSSRDIQIADSTSQIVGTSNLKSNVGFLGNYHKGDEADNSKVVVSLLGVVPVKTNDLTIKANDRVVSDDNGYAIKSSNNCGYRVLNVLEDGLLSIVVSPNTDMIQRIKNDMPTDEQKASWNAKSDFTETDFLSYWAEHNSEIRNLNDNLNTLTTDVNTVGGRVTALEQKPEVEPYDDTQIKEDLTALQDEVDGKEDASNKSSVVDDSTTKYPTNKAVKDYVAEHGSAYDDTEIRKEISQVSESITEISESAKSGIPSWKSFTDKFEVGGFIAKNGRMTVSKNYITPFIKVKKGQRVYTYSSQDFNNTFGIGLYSTDEETSFIKGINVCDASKTYKLVTHDYEVETDCFIRVSTMDNSDNGLKSVVMISEDKANSNVFADVYGTIGNVDTEYTDITDEIFANASEGYLNQSGQFLAYADAICSDFIEVEVGETYYYSLYTLYNNVNVHFYTERKTLIKNECKGTGVYVDGVVVVEPIVKYMRVCSFNKTVRPNYVIKKLGKIDVVEMMNRKVADKYFKSPVSYADVTGEKSIGYLIDNGGVQPSATEYATSEYIDITKYDWFKCRVSYGWAARGYVITNENKEKLFSLQSASGKNEIISLNTADILAEYPTAKYIRFCGDSSGKEELTVYANELTIDAGKIFKDVAQCGNVLYGKKIAFCGDSFTEASNLGNEYYDKFQSCYKSYGWMIATRNAMKLYHDGRSGTTMHIVDVDNPNDRKPFSYQRYKDVPKDCDYILLQFGLNESGLANSAETKGTKDSTDCTTMWGSWNTVLEYLITECPTARIGVIMSDAWMPQNYYLTLKEICEWWGIPMLDLGGDPNVPLMNSGRRNGCGLTVNPKVVKLRNDAFYTDPIGGDSHPNYKGHVWRSTVIENFIRSL